MVLMDALYLFDHNLEVKKMMHDGVEALVHHEAAGQITATIPGNAKPEPGDVLGFLCIDGRFRLFCLTDTEYEDATGQNIVDGVDLAIREMTETVIPGEKQLLDVTAAEAVAAWLQGTGWQIGVSTAGSEKRKLRTYYQPLWEIMAALMDAYAIRIVPYYVMQDGKIAGRRVDIMPDAGVYRGRLIESGYDADKVTIERINVPVTAVYPLGAPLGEDEMSPYLTIAEVAWSKSAGDPADKPAGQDWIGDPDALARYGRDGQHRFTVAVFDDITDPAELIRAGWDHLQTINRPKVIANGSLYDIEMIDGAVHAAIRVGDIIRLRPAAVEADVEARITEIKRDYVHRERTRFEIGDRGASVLRDIRGISNSVQHTQKQLTIYKNYVYHSRHLLDLTADVVSIHGDQLTEISAGLDRVSSVVLLLDEKIQLAAGSLDVTADGRVIIKEGSGLYIERNGTQLGVYDSGNLTAGVLVQKLNGGGTTVKIKADVIDLDGYVTVKEFEAEAAKLGFVTTKNLEAEMADIFDLWAQEFSTRYLSADSVVCGTLDADEIVCGPLSASGLKLGGQDMGLHSAIQVCTRSATYYSNTADISYLDWNGNKKTATFATGITQAQSPSHRTISYIGPV